MWRRNSREVEEAARKLYDRLYLNAPSGMKWELGPIPEWLPGGNSQAQEMCRSAVIDCLETAYPTDPADVLEKMALESAVARMGWPEINAYHEELRRGQDVREDAGGYFMRAIRRLLGLGTTKETVETYKSAAQRMIEKHLGDGA